MKKYNFSQNKILIVDDHNFSRITVLRMLKNMGDPITHSASTGAEAIPILQQYRIDCAIVDFNMPVMHGLQLLKAIRIGYEGVERNTPVIMLTGHGDHDLVQLAVALDVNSFILKPATQESMGERLTRIFRLNFEEDDWLKPVEDYKELNVNASVGELLQTIPKNEPQAVQEIKPQKMAVEPSHHVAVSLDEVKVNSIIAKNVVGKDGQIFVNAGMGLSDKRLQTLRDMAEMGIISNEIWIKA